MIIYNSKFFFKKDILADLGSNPWIETEKSEEAEVLENINFAIENVGREFGQKSGVLHLQEIKSTTVESESKEIVPEKNEIEKELEVAMKSRKRRRQLEIDETDEITERLIDSPSNSKISTGKTDKLHEKVESVNSTPKETKKQKRERKQKEAVIDLEKVLLAKGGKSDAKINETEDADGTQTTIHEAFQDDNVVR